MRTALIYFLLLTTLFSPARAVTREQFLSRENPLYSNRDSELTVGRDGMVYLHSRVTYNGYVVRMTRGGKEKTGGDTGYATGNVATNADGVLAAANEHFTHSVGVYDNKFNRLGGVDDFVSWTKEFGEASGYNDPARVEAGQSGDFYALDQFRDVIVRISPEAKALKKYAVPRDGTGTDPSILSWDFRVSEKAELFYVSNRAKNQIRGIGFDGKEKWKTAIDTTGGWDVDDAGVLYAASPRRDAIQKFGAEGKPAGEINLTGDIAGEGDFKSALQKFAITSLRVFGNEVFVKRQHPTEMFLRFDATSGVLKQAITSEFETLKAIYPSEIWTAGQNIDFSIAHTDPIHNAKPQWHVWMRGMTTPDYRELPIQNGKVQVPADAAGIYQIKVTPEVQPILRGTPSEYLVQSWIEVRAADSQGTANVFTADNRVSFARGENIPFAILLRGAKELEGKPLLVAVQLRETKSGRVIAEQKSNLSLSQSSQFSISPTLTNMLLPGHYVLSASTPGLTTVPQQLVIGDTRLKSSFFNVMYGDYQQPGFFPNATAATTADLTTSYVERQRKLGVNLVVERLGHTTYSVDTRLQYEMETLRARLAADPLAVAPDKVLLASPLLQTMSALGAHGISEMAILLYMDTALPIEAPNDPKNITDRITALTNGLKPYPAFRGWSWVANWWIWDQNKIYASPEEKVAYDAAIKKAKETGEWSAVLDTVGNRRLSFGIDAEHRFHELLDKLAPGRVSALSGPYRAVDSAYPPLSFAGADEVDLHYQMEQINPPFTTWHNVDYQKRPGKIAWGHPELWNDNGTGEQILNSTFGLAMRGADGIGTSGTIPNWGRQPEDVRNPAAGTTSIFRTTFNLFRQYGPWLQSLQPNDHVAIVVSGRMAKIDQWNAVGGEYFTRLFEAYQSCLYAHRPASFVFAEDLKPGTLAKYQAVIVAAQTVEFEPGLKSALDAVKAKVFYDDSCRESLVKEYSPLGVAFDHLTRDGHSGQDDSDFPRFADYFKTNAKTLSKVLAAIAPPAETDATEVLLTERAAENGRYLWVLNNTLPDMEIGKLWRIAKYSATRWPVSTTLKFNASGKVVYDVFAQKQITPQNGTVVANLRTLPARLYAILPSAIDRVALRGPGVVTEGGSFKWFVQVRDASDKPIAASVPVRLRLLSGTEVLDERILASGAAGNSGTMTLSLGASTPVLEATELFTGKTSRLALKSTPAALPIALDKKNKIEDAAANASGEKFAAMPNAPESDLGARARDIVVSGDGTTAVVNAMNWDGNLFGLDVQTGKVKWQNRVGNHFTYGPHATQNGFVVQGFDMDSAEGYHLYAGNSDGKITRRFALDGVPKGSVNWAWTAGLMDNINNFAVPQSANWIASAADLGVAVWDKSGKLLWSQDWRVNRHNVKLAAQGESTLIIGEGATATAFNAQTGAQKWQTKLSPNGEIKSIVASRDGSTLAFRTSSDSGRVFLLRSGKIVNNILTPVEDIGLSADGSTLAVLTANLLKIYDIAGGLKWSYAGDDTIHYPRFSPDNTRIAVSSELGTTTVLSRGGKVLYERDMKSLAAPTWMSGGDLLLATWNGDVSRFDANYKRLWTSRLQPSGAALTEANIPTTRNTSWINADTKEAPLTPNLLADTHALFSVTLNDRAVELKNKVPDLSDGKPDAPAQPWLSWSNINMIESGWQGPMVIIFDTFRTQIRLTGITFVEDPKHPESWLRDANLEYWDAEKAKWVFGASLLSDSAKHTHTFARPIESAKFRLLKSSTPGVWPVGNLRWGEVVFHGEALGASHPDVIAKRPRAVLFDEGEDLTSVMLNISPYLESAYSGGRSIKVEADRNGVPNWTPPWGHALPNWNFPIRENPQPGEYRWLQFAWKALSPGIKSIEMLIGNPFPGPGVSLVAGDYKAVEGVLVEKKIADAPPTQWKTVRVDMWELAKKPLDVQCIILRGIGGAAAFDQIVLGRTEADLPPQN